MIEDVLSRRAMHQAIAEAYDEGLRRADAPEARYLWEPDPENLPQCDAFVCEADELFFGGQAGGGKSDLVLGLAIEGHRRSVIFRREFWQTRELIERSKEIIGQAGRFNENLHVWRGLPGDRMIEFGGLRAADSWEAWKGRPHDLYAFDEVTEMLEVQYRNIIAWLRSTISGQRVRVVATGNPPTSDEGVWVIRYWGPWLDKDHPNPARPGELRWFARINDEDVEVDGPDDVTWTDPRTGRIETVTPRSRTFIPATLDDNPYLRDSGYRTVLQSLMEPLRSQLLYGDFTLTQVDDPFQVIRSEDLELAFKRWEEKPTPDVGLTSLGVDPSRGGRNKTVIAQRFGEFFAKLIKYAGAEMDTGGKVAAAVIKALGKWVNAAVNVDPLGVGSSPVDYLVDNGVDVQGINFGLPALDVLGNQMTDRSGKYRLINIRTAAYWKFREALHPEFGDDLRLPRDPELKQELLAHRWRLTPRGIQVKPKADVADDIGRSPDSADAVVLAFWRSASVGDWTDVENLGHVEDFESRWA